MRGSLLVLLAAAVLAGCASAATGASDRSGTVITFEELSDVSSGLNAYEAVERLRPRWLGRRSQSFSGSTSAGVIVDGLTRGGPELLRSLSAESIRELRFLPPSDATNRYGSGYPAGVIEVATRN